LKHRPPGREQPERENDDKSRGKTRRRDPKQRRKTPLGLVIRGRLFFVRRLARF
jgi:hypothetical protein